MAISTEQVLSQATSYANAAYLATMEQSNNMLDSMAKSANQLYIQAANQAAVQAGSIGAEKALRQALTDMAGKGVSVSTYMRKDGTVVTTPVDVGVRRMINVQLRQREIQQVASLAEELGRNYVEVSTTANCRESHAVWQGQIYSLDPNDDTYPYFYSACEYEDPVNGIGGYNCGHMVHIYRPELGKTFSDPLEGTDYTTEQVRELTTKQRRLENNIRKLKRQINALEAAGLDASALKAKLRACQQQLRELLNTHDILIDLGGYRTGINKAQTYLSNRLKRIIKASQGNTEAKSDDKNYAINYKNYDVGSNSCKDFQQLSEYLFEKYGVQIDESVYRLDFNAVKKAIIGMEVVFKKFPGTSEEFNRITTNKNSNDYMSITPHGTLYFNESKYQDFNKLEKKYASEVKAGDYPNNSTLVELGSHEAAHLLERYLINRYYEDYSEEEKLKVWENSEISKGIIIEAWDNLGGERYNYIEDLISKISGYAKDNEESDNYSEVFAEAIHDYITNEGQAAELSREVWKVLKEKRF